MTTRDRSWLRQPFAPVAVVPPSGAVLDEENRTVLVDGVPVRFSEVEFALASLLLRHPGVLITREELSMHAWGRPLQTSDQVTSAIKRIRVRLREAGLALDPITTVHALGYRWEQTSADRVWQDLGRTG